MDDLDRPVERRARREVEHEAISEERGVERRERLGRVGQRGAHQLGPVGDRLPRRAEPDAFRSVAVADKSAEKQPSTSTIRAALSSSAKPFGMPIGWPISEGSSGCCSSPRKSR